MSELVMETLPRDNGTASAAEKLTRLDLSRAVVERDVDTLRDPEDGLILDILTDAWEICDDRFYEAEISYSR